MVALQREPPIFREFLSCFKGTAEVLEYKGLHVLLTIFQNLEMYFRNGLAETHIQRLDLGRGNKLFLQTFECLFSAQRAENMCVDRISFRGDRTYL